jgi:hypothetical protein
METIPMQRTLTLAEKWEIIEHEWAQARAKNPEVILRVHVDDKTDERGKPQVHVVIAFHDERRPPAR